MPLVQRNSFGEVGLLEMPSAREAPDGQLSLSANFLKDAQRIDLGFQILPWLEGSFRYSRIAHWVNNRPDYDRSFGLKMRLFTEGEYMPDVSFGIRDLVGTGIYGSEYLVATKQFWDFDVTMGLGWGRLASNGTFRNPFGLIFKSFNTRTSPTGVGGKVDFGQFLHGPDMGVFGGVTWQTPIKNLNLTFEYSSDNYQRESKFGNNPVRSPLDVGVTYAPLNGVTLTAGWFYGSTYAATVTVAIDPTIPASPAIFGTPPKPVMPRTDEQQQKAVAALLNGRVDDASPPTVVGALTDMPPPVFGSRAQRAALPPGIGNAMGAPQNVEIDGNVLLVDVHASGRGNDYCKIYGSMAAAAPSRIDSVAVTDLDDPRGKIALCQVPESPDRGRVLQTSADAGGDEMADEAPRANAGPFNAAAAERNIRQDAAAQSLRIEAISIGEHEVLVYYSNTRYQLEATAIGRLVRILMADAPPSVEIFRVVPVYFGQPTQDIQIFRSPLERMFAASGSTAELHSAVGLRPAPLDNPVLESAQGETYPRVSWSVGPSVRQALFDPNSPLRVQIYASATGSVDIMPGLSVEGELQANIFNTFGGALPSTSELPHVRSDFLIYLTKGKNGLSNLDMVYRGRLTPDLFLEAKAGYLEDMFAGAGGQILWRRENSRWALGADVYEVWQRNFDRLLGLQPYHVLTGHVSIYYQSPWYGMNVNLHVGRYLARDNGFTLEATRSFATGVEVGAFATFTNVPFVKFGEGSFDKGITVRIPLEWAMPFSTQSAYNLVLRPLTRDGGQRLVNDDSLYSETRRMSYDEIIGHANSIAYP